MLDRPVELVHPEARELRFDHARDLCDRQGPQARVLRFDLDRIAVESERALAGFGVALDALDRFQLTSRVLARHLLQRVTGGSRVEQIRAHMRIEMEALQRYPGGMQRQED